MARKGAGLESMDAELMLISDAVAECRRDREEHIRSRPCIVDGCKGGFRCRRHGTPAESYGEWLFEGRVA